MVSISLSSIFLGPLVVLISVPLLLSACVTICFSVLTLYLRAFVVYLKLLYAIVTSLFAFPTSSSSLLNFSASGATTPNVSRSKGLKNSSASFESFLQSSEFGPRLQSHQSRRSGNKPQQGNATLLSEDGILRNYHLQLISSTRRQSYYRGDASFPEGFLGLTTGDANRDFEGLGGWRSLPSTEGSQSINDDPDERAWLSINNRLELPSRLPSIESSASDTKDISAKHHKRSATTSALTNDGGASATGSSLKVRNASNSTSSVDLRPQFSSPNLVPEGLGASASRTSLTSQTSFPKPNMSKSRSRLTSSPEFHSGDGYFALRRPRSNSKPSSNMGGNTTPRTPDERASMNIGFSISHYPTSPGRRRRTSLAGGGSGGSPTFRTAVSPTSALLGVRPEVHDDFHAW
ncbi:hypothetical protein DTO282F9_1395 [Paecilomyces variotii]|nr:hypothetical protein DTO282E5_985 [Paecilomyces variotii]KAJ9401625.1 hypothetical protein DTO282F9_1395 [Paecilomyces variotii]